MTNQAMQPTWDFLYDQEDILIVPRVHARVNRKVTFTVVSNRTPRLNLDNLYDVVVGLIEVGSGLLSQPRGGPRDWL